MTTKAQRRGIRNAAKANRRKAADRHKLRELEQRCRIRDILAKDAPCTDCGKTFHPVVMEFDHARGRKLFNISEGPTGLALTTAERLAALEKELDKCDLVCANCHRLRHLTRHNQRKEAARNRMLAIVEEVKQSRQTEQTLVDQAIARKMAERKT